MSQHNNIYNILGKLSALEPKPAPAKNILSELAEPAPMKDLATRLNERYLAEKDMGKHNNATTGFKALAKKAGGGEKGEKIAGAQFQKMKKAGQLEERQVDGGLTRMKKPAQQMNHTYEESSEMDEDMLSPKEKSFAKLAPPKDKVTYADKIAGAKKKEVDEDEFDSHDGGEYDREGEMADQDLETAEDAAEELRSILSADENLPEWVQAKITKAVDYLDTARDYMQSKDSEEVAEGWDDMMKDVKDRSEKGTGKFDKQVTSTGTRYTRKSDTFSDDSDDKETTTSDGPKKKGRPKKDKAPERTTSKAWKHKGGRVSEGETIKTKTGLIHKGTYGSDWEDPESKETGTSDAPKKKGRPAKAKQPERVTSKAWKHKDGRKIGESVKLDTFVEDTLAEMDNILSTKQPVEQRKQKFMGMVSESMLTESSLEAICHRYGKECKDFMTSGAMHDDLFHALYDHYFDDMPYGVKKARDGDPYEWVSDRFHDDMGGNDYDAGPDALSTLPRKIEVDESGAFHPGRTVYYRGQEGIVDRVEGNKCFVHTGDGDMDVWPTRDCDTQKQSMLSTLGKDIKDIGYGMKGFLTGGPETRELDELAKLAGLGRHNHDIDECNYTTEGNHCPVHGLDECSGSMYESKEKKADKDYDKDGEVESEKDEVIGSRRKAAGLDESKPDFLDMDKDGDKKEPMKKAIGDKKKNPFGNKKDLDECDMPGSMSPMGSTPSQSETGMNISGSLDTKTGKKTLNVSADGEAAEELAQMLKMAGLLNGTMGGVDSHEAEPQVTGKVVLIRPQGHDSMMGEAFANEPDEQYADTEVITDQGTDLNRKKKQDPATANKAANPASVKLESKLQSLYDSLKVKAR
jgi:hypothetical protein